VFSLSHDCVVENDSHMTRFGTNEVLCPTPPTISAWSPSLAPGPYWNSFEQFRIGGTTALESINIGSVATLRSKTTCFRILRDEDFQRVIGLASEVHRLKQGITFVVQAARVVAKHKDQESIELLIRSVSMLGESPVLPEREGHDQFEITKKEILENSGDDFDVKTANIPRPL